MFSLSTFDNYYDEAIEKGMSKNQANDYAFDMTFYESATEYGISADRIAGLKQIGEGVGIKNFVLGLSKDMGENFLQEFVMEPLGLMTENKINGNPLLEGFDDPELWQRAWNSGCDGALSSILFTGSTRGVASCTNLMTKVINGETLTQQEVVDTLHDCEEAGIPVKEVFKETVSKTLEYAKENQETLKQQPTVTALQQNDNATNYKNAINEINQGVPVQQAVENNTQKLPTRQENAPKLSTETEGTPGQELYQVDLAKDTLDTTLKREYFNNEQDYNKARNFGKGIQAITEKAGNGLKVLFDTSVEGNGLIVTKDGQRALIVNPTTKNSMEEVIVHELFHNIKKNAKGEITQEFKDIGNILDNFAQKFNLKDSDGNLITLESAKEGLRQRYENFYDTHNLDKSNLDIDEEAHAFMLQKIIGDSKTLNSLTQQHRPIVQAIYDAVEKLSMKLKGVDKETANTIIDLRNKLRSALQNNQATAEATGQNYSIDSNKNARFSQDRLEYLIRGSINEYSKGGNYARSYITKMTPQQFLDLTNTPEGLEQMRKNVGKLDTEQLKKEQQNIYLKVDMETGRVLGHEGRHRMIALQKAGINNVDIEIIPAERNL